MGISAVIPEGIPKNKLSKSYRGGGGIMHFIQVAIIAVILSWALTQLSKIPGELLRIMKEQDVDIFQKRKNLTPSPNYVRFKLPHIKLHRKAC